VIASRASRAGAAFTSASTSSISQYIPAAYAFASSDPVNVPQRQACTKIHEG
jgi:hypothetical protein